MRLARSVPIAATLALAACGNGTATNSDSGTPGQDSGTATLDAGGTTLASLTDECQGVTGLTGQSILDQRADQINAMLTYTPPTTTPPPPSAVTIDITWPATPTATCYPAYSATIAAAQPRVGISGLTMHYHTADGMFDETLPAVAFRFSNNGFAIQVQVVAATTRAGIHGTYRPSADITPSLDTVYFAATLTGATSDHAGTVVGLSAAPTSELYAGIFRSGSAVATGQ